MQLLKIKDTESSYELLVWCENATVQGAYGDFSKLRNITLNNLGCLYRRVGKLKQAINCLREALSTLQKSNNMIDSANTYLNLSAVLSQWGK